VQKRSPKVRIRTRPPILAAMGSIIRLAAIVMSGFVLAGFALFAADELDRGSKTQQQALASELQAAPEDLAPSPRTGGDEVAREAAHSGLREIIDDVNDVLLAPFADLVESNNSWVAHGVPAILALLLYGPGFGLLANMLPKRQAPAGDWRGAEL
jgi:hypothetical protein